MEKVEFWLNPIFHYYCKRAATGSFELLLSTVSFLVSKSGAFMQKKQSFLLFPYITLEIFSSFVSIGKFLVKPGLTEAPGCFEVHSLNTLQKRFLRSNLVFYINEKLSSEIMQISLQMLPNNMWTTSCHP